jgi:regulator of protease activity HflC (stomatin/prohibitin superfamily)
LDVSGIVPFRLALVERITRYKGDLLEYRMVLVHPTEACIMPTSSEMARARADQEAERADQEAERADQEAERANQEAERANRLQNLVEKYRAEFGDLDM